MGGGVFGDSISADSPRGCGAVGIEDSSASTSTSVFYGFPPAEAAVGRIQFCADLVDCVLLVDGLDYPVGLLARSTRMRYLTMPASLTLHGRINQSIERIPMAGMRP